MQVVRGDVIRGLGTGVLLILVWLFSLRAQANHIIGGDVSMQAVGTKPGLFRLQLNQYWDETKIVSGNRDALVTLLVYRKQNPILVERITLYIKEILPLTFGNAACATLRQLDFSQARYYDNHQFDPTKYTDPGGYYIVWERCCRNDGLTNVNTAVAAGVAMTFYLEFPPMLKNGVNYTNSAPNFSLPNGDYICINKPFTFDAGATDSDGDLLRYSLVTPLNGFTTKTSPGVTNEAPRSSYPTINWAPGFSLSTIIPGNPPLTIDPATGVLTLRATTQGLYLFSVQCEEFRNGQRIGIVRRDFQLPVVDCSKSALPPAVVTTNGKPATDLTSCGNQPLILSVEKNSIWAYQWQKDGNNIRGSTNDTLQVRASGVYTVIKSQARACANDTTSQAVKVTITSPPSVKLSVANSPPYCSGDTLTLKTDGQPDYQYSWQTNGKAIAGEQQATLRVYQSGTYSLLARIAGATCEGRDSLTITINPRPTAKINAPAAGFCQDQSITLSADNGVGYRYKWQNNGSTLTDTTTSLLATQAGTYQVIVTASTGCTATSPPVTLAQYDRPIVQFDSVPPICLTSNAIVSLAAQPGGGTFTGPGTRGNSFDATIAGVGVHELTYRVLSDQGCPAEKKRSVTVSPAVNLTGQDTLRLAKGQTVQLLVQADQPISQYQWEPPTYLSQADIKNPIASPLETTPYALTATSTAGCTATFSVLVIVADLLDIPSAFSPNGDGLNDSWILPNISAFPEREVSIYNRWGELVFFSHGYEQPWNGTYKQELVQTGVYTYQIRINDGTSVTSYRGQLMVIR